MRHSNWDAVVALDGIPLQTHREGFTDMNSELGLIPHRVGWLESLPQGSPIRVSLNNWPPGTLTQEHVEAVRSIDQTAEPVWNVRVLIDGNVVGEKMLDGKTRWPEVWGGKRDIDGHFVFPPAFPKERVAGRLMTLTEHKEGVIRLFVSEGYRTVTGDQPGVDFHATHHIVCFLFLHRELKELERSGLAYSTTVGARNVPQRVLAFPQFGANSFGQAGAPNTVPDAQDQYGTQPTNLPLPPPGQGLGWTVNPQRDLLNFPHAVNDGTAPAPNLAPLAQGQLGMQLANPFAPNSVYGLPAPNEFPFALDPALNLPTFNEFDFPPNSVHALPASNDFTFPPNSFQNFPTVNEFPPAPNSFRGLSTINALPFVPNSVQNDDFSLPPNSAQNVPRTNEFPSAPIQDQPLPRGPAPPAHILPPKYEARRLKALSDAAAAAAKPAKPARKGRKPTKKASDPANKASDPNKKPRKPYSRTKVAVAERIARKEKEAADIKAGLKPARAPTRPRKSRSKAAVAAAAKQKEEAAAAQRASQAPDEPQDQPELLPSDQHQPQSQVRDFPNVSIPAFTGTPLGSNDGPRDNRTLSHHDATVGTMGGFGRTFVPEFARTGIDVNLFGNIDNAGAMGPYPGTFVPEFARTGSDENSFASTNNAGTMDGYCNTDNADAMGENHNAFPSEFDDVLFPINNGDFFNSAGNAGAFHNNTMAPPPGLGSMPFPNMPFSSMEPTMSTRYPGLSFGAEFTGDFPGPGAYTGAYTGSYDEPAQQLPPIVRGPADYGGSLQPVYYEHQLPMMTGMEYVPTQTATPQLTTTRTSASMAPSAQSTASSVSGTGNTHTALIPDAATVPEEKKKKSRRSNQPSSDSEYDPAQDE